MMDPMSICESKFEMDLAFHTYCYFRYDVSKALIAAGAKGTFFFSM